MLLPFSLFLKLCSESAVLLPVHRPVPLCAKMAIADFDATMTHKWTRMGGFHNALTVFICSLSHLYFFRLFQIFANLAKICRGVQCDVTLLKKERYGQKNWTRGWLL